MEADPLAKATALALVPAPADPEAKRKKQSGSTAVSELNAVTAMTAAAGQRRITS